MSNDREKRLQERENLRNIIAQWNANRLDLFELSEPNEELEFHGVMRFYFQDSGQKVATKCIRVSSTAGARDVVITLIEKFRPDIRMLSIPEYALYEIHENGGQHRKTNERKLGEEEKPLLVQLNWHKDDREGRFLLRRMDEKSFLPSLDPESRSFRRKLSKREKKEKKKREKRERQKENEDRKDGIAEKLYSELPETSFTRSISNPEAVMRRRRQQKLERKLMQFRQEGGPDAGGTLRIFGESLNRDVPYKTLLLSTRECSAYVVREILDKYAMEDEDSSLYCLVQVILPTSAASMAGELHEYQGSVIREYILDDDDCPLLIEKQHNRSKGILMFHIRRRPADYQPRKRKKKPKPSKSSDLDNGTKEEPPEKLPLLLELNPDGSEVVQGPAKKHSLFLNVTEVGCERSSSTSGQHLQLFGPNVQSRHCVIAHTEGIVTVTPSSCDAETYVNGIRIYETTILQHGAIVRFGKLHTFRFVDPLHDERRRLSSPDQRQVDYVDRNARKEDPLNSHHHSSYETTFDADGNIETVSTHSRDDRMSRKSDDLNSHRSFGREGAQSRGEKTEPRRMMGDAILPAVLEFWEDGEDAFLNAVINQLEPSQVQFKLAPTYILYMAARYRASTHYRPDAQPTDRAMRLTTLMIKIAGHIHQVIQDKYRDSTSLAFWLANTSELLHFLKQDRHLSAYTLDAQDLLAESVQLAFRSLVTCQQGELQMAMQAILEDRDDINEEQGTTSDILGVLSSAMSLLRRCRVNAALTIQLFSQLFHYINMWLVNRVLCELDPPFNLCSRLWGVRLKRRLDRIELWAEKQGLELAADCHLSRIIQAAHLLQAPKSSPEDIAAISSACFKLNSLQLRTLLENYQPVPDEPSIPGELIDTVVKVAQNTADELARSDGREVKLEEDPDLQLPFLLPEDGYSCDIVKGVATGLQDCLQPLVRAGLCRLTVQPSSSGCWKIYMTDQDIGRAVTGANSPSVGSVTGTGQSSGAPPTGLSQQGDGCSVDQVPTTGGQSGPLVGPQHQRGGPALPPEPEVMTIKLQKSNSGMGLSIVAARGVGQDKLGIYIKSVVKGGAADQDARLQAGDQLLKVDGQSLIGISQEKAAELMTRTGAVVTLEVAKQGAIYHGLAALLSQPSPVMQRGGTGPRRMSERDIPSRLVQDQSQQILPPRIQGSKSVPSLNCAPGLQDPPLHPQQQSNRTHDIYNPAYGRNPALISGPKSDLQNTDFDGRTKLTGPQHPTYDSRYAYPAMNNNSYGVNGMNGTLPNRQPPHIPQQPTHPSAGHGLGPAGGHLPHPNSNQSEERHYQNISMYQQQQQPNYNAPPRPPSGPFHQRALHGSHASLMRSDQQGPVVNQTGLPGPQPVMDNKSRPLSTLVSPREQEQYVNSLGYNQGMGPPTSPQRVPQQPGVPFRPGEPHRPPMQQPQYVHRGEFRGPDLTNHLPEDMPDGLKGIPGGHYGPQQHPGGPAMDPRQRDILRQEAKMEEMREEVRRREEREHGHPQGPRPTWAPRGPGPQQPPYPGQQGYPPQPPYPPNNSYGGGGPRMAAPPPGAGPIPKPRYGERPLWGYEGSDSEKHLMYRESPPPPPPPNSTHPLLQSGTPAPAVSYRYGPSGYPPRPGETEAPFQQQRTGPPPPLQPGRTPPQTYGKPQSAMPNRMVPDVVHHSEKKDFSLASPSPWEREEKEKLRKQRVNEAHQLRDEEISQLEGLGARSSKQEERLRTLRLEQEFQRRAEEMHGQDDDEDDDELLERAENRERILRMQEDLERTRQRRLEWENEQRLKQQQQRIHVDLLQEQEGRLSTLRLEEVTRKKELEATKEAEEMLLKEARRRQEEEIRNHSLHNSQPSSGHQRLDNLLFSSGQAGLDTPPALPTSPPPLDSELGPSIGGSSTQRLDVDAPPPEKPTSAPPAPPERKSSYEVTSGQAPVSKYPSVLRNGDVSHPTTQKKVSFHDSKLETEITNDNSYTLDDIDEGLGTPPPNANSSFGSSVMNSSFGSTPGVIGAQEVYRDPRQRIEAERYQQQLNTSTRTSSLGPEKLSFREKMKMFALETGQEESPKDKVKISKAQREIENRVTGPPATAATSS